MPLFEGEARWLGPPRDWVIRNNEGRFELLEPVSGTVVLWADSPSDGIFLAQQGYQSVTGPGYNAPTNGSADARTAFFELDAALTALGGVQGLYVPPGTYRVASNLTLNHHVSFAPGAVLLPDNGVRITFKKSPGAGLWQIFDLSNGGLVTLETGSKVSPEWFGALEGVANDSTSGIQHAIDTAASARGTVEVSAGLWAHTGLTISYPQWTVNLQGVGQDQSVLVNTHATNHSLTLDGIHRLLVRDLGFRGTMANVDGNAIQMVTTSGFQNFMVEFEHLWLHQHGGNGIVGSCFSSRVEHVQFGSNSTDDASAGGTAHLGKNGLVISAVLSLKVESCWFADLQDGRTGIIFQAGNHGTITDCNFSSETAGTSWFGIQSVGLGSVTITGNNFECDAANTCSAAIQFLTTAWNGGLIAGNSYIDGSGTIQRDIWLSVGGSSDDAQLTVIERPGQGRVDMGNISTGWVIGMPYVAPTNDANARYRGFYRGGLRFHDGHRQTIDGWYQDNVAASQTAVVLSRGPGASSYWMAPRGGSVTGLIVRSSDARVAGTLTVEVYIGGVATGIQATLDASNTTVSAPFLQSKDLDAFSAGAIVDLRVTTDGSWSPTTADIQATLEVET